MRIELQSFWNQLTASLIALVCVLTIFILLVRSTSFERVIDRVSGLKGRSGERELVSRTVRSYFFAAKPLSAALFDEREREHLADVKQLFDRLNLITACAAVAALVGMYATWRSHQTRLIRLAAAYGMFYAGAGIAALIFFDRIFLLFHTVAFTNDFWQLDPARHALIRAYPPVFFLSFFALFVLCIAASAAMLWFVLRRIGNSEE